MNLIKEKATAKFPTKFYGDFVIHIYEDDKANHHIALVKGDAKENVLVRVHSECMTGDTLHSLRCDCGEQLEKALEIIGKQNGVLLYLRQEGRGIGLANKVRAYALQQKEGLDTVEANKRLGFSSDLRDYGIGAQILKELGVGRLRLLTNNPCKIVGLEGHGLHVTEQVSLELDELCAKQKKYLRAKKEKMGHTIKTV